MSTHCSLLMRRLYQCRALLSLPPHNLPYMAFQCRANRTSSKLNITEIEKLVDLPVTFLGMEYLQNDEIFYLMGKLQKLMGSGHPIVEFGAQTLLGSSGTFRIHGLVSLLLSQLVNQQHWVSPSAYDRCMILPKQRRLVEVCEMISTALYLHDNIVSLNTVSPARYTDYKTGNKLSLLFGDYFLSAACSQLATMENPEVVTSISNAIARNVEGRFWLETIDTEGLPSEKELDQYCSLKHGALLSSCCHSLALLNGNHRDDAIALQKIGRHLGQALQLKREILSVKSSSLNPDITSSYPFVISLINFSDISSLKSKVWDEQLLREILEAGDGIDRSVEKCKYHCEQAKVTLTSFNLNDKVSNSTVNIIDNINSENPIFSF